MKTRAMKPHPSKAEIENLAHEIAANRSMAELVYHVALKAHRIMGDQKVTPPSLKSINWSHCGQLFYMGKKLALIAHLKPDLSPIEQVEMLDEYGLLPKELFNSLTLGEAITVLSVPEAMP